MFQDICDIQAVFDRPIESNVLLVGSGKKHNNRVRELERLLAVKIDSFPLEML